MKPLKCGGCRQCCKWGKDLKLRPVLTKEESEHLHFSTNDKNQIVIRAKPNGDCIYLGPNGCDKHNSPYYPASCKEFDCRVMWNEYGNNSPLMKIMVEGSKRSL